MTTDTFNPDGQKEAIFQQLQGEPCPKCVATPERGTPYSLYRCAGADSCPKQAGLFSFDPPPGYTTTFQLLKKASRDTDVASSFVLGESWEKAQGSIVVVKGGHAAKAVHDMLVSLGYITPGKAVCS